MVYLGGAAVSQQLLQPDELVLIWSWNSPNSSMYIKPLLLHSTYLHHNSYEVCQTVSAWLGLEKDLSNDNNGKMVTVTLS